MHRCYFIPLLSSIDVLLQPFEADLILRTAQVLSCRGLGVDPQLALL